MGLSTPVKALALVVFLAAIAGATYGVREVVGDTLEAQSLAVTSPRDELNATPGHTVTYVVTVTNRDSAARTVVVEVAGVVSGRSMATTVRGNTNESIFVPVTLPAELRVGAHPLDVRVLDGDALIRERKHLLTLNVLPEGPGFTAADLAEANYVGRLTATGRVFNTNDPALVGLSIPKTDTYRFSQGLLTVVGEPRPNVVQGLYQGMLGMQPGESRTLSFPPELGYGPATSEERYPRDDIIQRDISLVNSPQRVTVADFNAFINESRQGKAGGYQVGDTFNLTQNNEQWPYEILNISQAGVEYRLVAKVGDAFTVYPFWPKGSVVTETNGTHVSFRTTPTSPEGAKLTFRQFWPEMSTVHSVNETHVVIRSSPPMGYSFTSLTQAGEPREARVTNVGEDQIVVSFPSSNPLAGKDLTFDITVVALEK